MLYTAQYRYSGDDRCDITIKTSTAWATFAPSWEMVTAWRNSAKDEMARARYTTKYIHLLNERHAISPKPFQDLAVLAAGQNITVVCFCAAGDFCHRILLAAWMELYYNTVYGGER